MDVMGEINEEHGGCGPEIKQELDEWCSETHDHCGGEEEPDESSGHEGNKIKYMFCKSC